MKFGAAKFLISIIYPAVLLSSIVFLVFYLASELAVWAFMIAPVMVSFLSIVLLGARFSSSSSRLAIAGVASTFLFCLLLPLATSAYQALPGGSGINFWPLLFTTYIYLIILFAIPVLVTTSAGIIAGLAYVARFGR